MEVGIWDKEDEKAETWFFSVVDIIQVLTQQPDFQAARNYWKVLKNWLRKEGNESVTNCNRLKLPADNGKMPLTDYWADHDIKKGDEYADPSPSGRGQPRSPRSVAIEAGEGRIAV